MSFDDWLVYGHVLAVLLFFMAHGGSAATVVILRRERDPARVKALLDLSLRANYVADAALLGLIVFGVWVGLTRGWWTNGQLWLWLSLAILVVVLVAMVVLISNRFYRLRDLWKDGGRPTGEDLAPLMAGDRPLAGATIGLAGMVVILWLMMAKPF